MSKKRQASHGAEVLHPVAARPVDTGMGLLQPVGGLRRSATLGQSAPQVASGSHRLTRCPTWTPAPLKSRAAGWPGTNSGGRSRLRKAAVNAVPPHRPGGRQTADPHFIRHRGDLYTALDRRVTQCPLAVGSAVAKPCAIASAHSLDRAAAVTRSSRNAAMCLRARTLGCKSREPGIHRTAPPFRWFWG